MNTIDFKNPKHIFFVGIGGISMSGLAMILKDRGFMVSGSDMKASDLTNKLTNLGIKVIIGHQSSNITADIDVVVYTAAVKLDNPELMAAKDRGIPFIERAVLLGELMSNFQKPIAITGTHGKTTTSSMVTSIFLENPLLPTVSIGGLLDLIKGNILIGSNEYFIAEACEYHDSFLQFFPHTSIILNVELDHVDYFKDLAQMRASFRQFIGQTHGDGQVLIQESIEDIPYLIGDYTGKVFTFGLSAASDFSGQNPRLSENGLLTYDFYEQSNFLGQVTLGVYGDHNISNSVSAIASGLLNGMSFETIITGLRKFTGTKRRFERKGTYKDAVVIDDYAHHPTEIHAMIQTARSVFNKKLTILFQPHTYSRTASFLKEFAYALKDADEVLILDIYAAREQNTYNISSEDLVDAIAQYKTPVKYMSTKEIALQYLQSTLCKDDVLITTGAGDVYLVGESLVN